MWKIIAMVAAVAFLASTASAEKNTLGPRWLVFSGDRQFCGPIPQVATMSMVQPKHMTPPCKPGKYHSALAKVFIMPLLVVIGVVLCGCGFCVKACCLSSPSSASASANGSRGGVPGVGFASTNSSLSKAAGDGRGDYGALPASASNGVSVNALYARRNGSPPVIAIVAAVGVVVAMAVAVAGGDEVRTLTYGARQLPAEHGRAQAWAPQSAAAVAALSSYSSGTHKIADSLASLDSLRAAFLIITAVFVTLAVVGGLAVHALNWRRLSLGLAIVGIVALACVWGNFMVYVTAANVISDMCRTINGCHFCYESGGSNCGSTVCAVPFFETLSACPASAQNRFQSLTAVAASATKGKADDVCAALDKLCPDGASCARTSGDCTASALGSGLSALVCDGPTCFPVSTVAANATGNPAFFARVDDAEAVMTAFAAFGTANSYQLGLTSLDCGSNNAFIERAPGGTYDSLQKFLCPRIVHPVNPPQHTFSVTAGGLLAAGLIFPLYVVWLVRAHHAATRRQAE
ncbi:uncharacterized protein AMSG_06111 [Thecamonas trahens ATCC 50062]|uniref:Uncharacterized protein n=1 Tax=Thecamonas trahens ATCC 50062 TaxID=461836 RepID=A0A0L0DC65_THETB|nr:hypothetical protein AMSG_06111 [Thecamonas trahens ATCC 50062]KNC49830.1 hypothetical protein AMSG_06111 [Thecamonas trahens ATCC 50062]|eukprot:XP_013757324.1 hypothetical protein AMSG_06111 [Thecamonas trahens ATCC 50062]